MSKSYIQKITPFIDNMRVGQDDGEEPSVSLIPFTETTILKEGDLVHFDMTRDNELLECLKSIDWTQYEEMGAAPLAMYYVPGSGGGIGLLFGEHFEDGETEFYLIGSQFLNKTGIVWSSESWEEEGIVKGWNKENMDEDGNIDVVKLALESGMSLPENEMPINTVVNTTPNWNGNIIGIIKGE